MTSLFNENYFENGINSGLSLYSNYRWIPELTIPMAFRIIEVLNINNSSTVLDFGCAKGYLVYALRLLYRKCYGVDISSYALSKCESSIKRYVQLINNKDDLLSLPFNIMKFDYILSKDVFEHIPVQELTLTLKNLRNICHKMFVIVPLGDGKKYYEPMYELDKTHIIREDIDWWETLFLSTGFQVKDVSLKIDGIKENWKRDKGNGFFQLL